jgi:hypothetical protein
MGNQPIFGRSGKIGWARPTETHRRSLTTLFCITHAVSKIRKVGNGSMIYTAGDTIRSKNGR